MISHSKMDIDKILKDPFFKTLSADGQRVFLELVFVQLSSGEIPETLLDPGIMTERINGNLRRVRADLKKIKMSKAIFQNDSGWLLSLMKDSLYISSPSVENKSEIRNDSTTSTNSVTSGDCLEKSIDLTKFSTVETQSIDNVKTVLNSVKTVLNNVDFSGEITNDPLLSFKEEEEDSGKEISRSLDQDQKKNKSRARTRDAVDMAVDALNRCFPKRIKDPRMLIESLVKVHPDVDIIKCVEDAYTYESAKIAQYGRSKAYKNVAQFLRNWVKNSKIYGRPRTQNGSGRSRDDVLREMEERRRRKNG